MALAYDVLVVDLDGTLLGRDGQVSARNRAAIAEARDAKLTIIIATGRALVESLGPLEAIEHDGLVVAAGGALLCDAASGRTIERNAMPRDLVAQATASLVSHGHKVLVLKDPAAARYDYLAVGPAELDPASEWWFGTLPVRVRFAEDIADDPHPHDTVRVGVIAQGRELGAIAQQLRGDLGERAFLQHWSAVTESEATGSKTHLLEVFNPNVNKWTMIETYCRREGIDPTRVIAIGDEINDLELIRNVGLGIAMGNAVPAVVHAAARVTENYDDHGLAVAVEHVLAGRW